MKVLILGSPIGRAVNLSVPSLTQIPHSSFTLQPTIVIHPVVKSVGANQILAMLSKILQGLQER